MVIRIIKSPALLLTFKPSDCWDLKFMMKATALTTMTVVTLVLLQPHRLNPRIHDPNTATDKTDYRRKAVIVEPLLHGAALRTKG
jgi:hypothetical protein